MLSTKVSIAIAIAVLIIFSGVAFETIEHSSSSKGVSIAAGYLKVKPNPVYLYDVSPIDNASYVWTNITSFNHTKYPNNFVEITNASSTPVKYSYKLYVNKSAYEEMKVTINPEQPHIYHALIILISANGNSAGFPVLFLKPYVPA